MRQRLNPLFLPNWAVCKIMQSDCNLRTNTCNPGLQNNQELSEIQRVCRAAAAWGICSAWSVATYSTISLQSVREHRVTCDSDCHPPLPQTFRIQVLKYDGVPDLKSYCFQDVQSEPATSDPLCVTGSMCSNLLCRDSSQQMTQHQTAV